MEVTLLKARLDRLERQERSNRTARAQATSKARTSGGAEVARLQF